MALSIQKDNLLIAGWVFLLAYGMYTAAIALTFRAFDPISAFFIYVQEYGLWFAVILYAFPIVVAYKALRAQDVSSTSGTKHKKKR